MWDPVSQQQLSKPKEDRHHEYSRKRNCSSRNQDVELGSLTQQCVCLYWPIKYKYIKGREVKWGQHKIDLYHGRLLWPLMKFTMPTPAGSMKQEIKSHFLLHSSRNHKPLAGCNSICDVFHIWNITCISNFLLPRVLSASAKWSTLKNNSMWVAFDGVVRYN